jgi:uncharacterized protein
MMKIWFDITNTPQVHFLLAILNGLKANGYLDFLLSARDFSETKILLSEKTDLPFKIIGQHKGKNMSKKALGLINRFFELNRNFKKYDASISCGSEGAIWSSTLKGKHSIAFGDNDLARQWTYAYFVDFAMFPKSIPASILHKQGLGQSKLYQYDGFKEHVYIADYQPDKDFLAKLPFDEYVVVRPENIQANYAQGETSKSITPYLLKLLSDRGINILFLPRYTSDRKYAESISNIYIPEKPLNGLDACFYSNGVFTGAGTFAREAACLGVPSFSFFLGERLLAVDKDLVKQEKMFFSRDPEEIVSRFIQTSKQPADLQKAKDVNEEVISKTIEFLNKFE